MAQFDQELDASGLNCPLPIIKATKMMNDLAVGNVLKVIATDPGSVEDFKAYSEQTGHKLLESTQQDSKFIYFLEKV